MDTCREHSGYFAYNLSIQSDLENLHNAVAHGLKHIEEIAFTLGERQTPCEAFDRETLLGLLKAPRLSIVKVCIKTHQIQRHMHPSPLICFLVNNVIPRLKNTKSLSFNLPGEYHEHALCTLRTMPAIECVKWCSNLPESVDLSDFSNIKRFVLSNTRVDQDTTLPRSLVSLRIKNLPIGCFYLFLSAIKRGWLDNTPMLQDLVVDTGRRGFTTPRFVRTLVAAGPQNLTIKTRPAQWSEVPIKPPLPTKSRVQNLTLAYYRSSSEHAVSILRPEDVKRFASMCPALKTIFLDNVHWCGGDSSGITMQDISSSAACCCGASLI